MKVTVATFAKMKQEKQKIACLTCYDASTAKIIDASNVDAILVGDSLGNVILGYEDTLSVTVDDMITFTGAVARGCKSKLIIADMPFMSYQVNAEQALINAGRLLKEGRANAVKLEGGRSVAATVKRIVDSGIPVRGHLGMTPQSVNAFGGHKVQGKTEKAAKDLIEDAQFLQEAGAFAIVLECVPAKLAAIVTEKLSIPTIGIGAGVECDGQILVYQDMLGMYQDFSPKFVKHFAEIGKTMKESFDNYAKEVKDSSFPAVEHTFKIDDEILNRLY